jgi:hypothetical protein
MKLVRILSHYIGSPLQSADMGLHALEHIFHGQGWTGRRYKDKDLQAANFRVLLPDPMMMPLYCICKDNPSSHRAEQRLSVSAVYIVIMNRGDVPNTHTPEWRGTQ